MKLHFCPYRFALSTFLPLGRSTLKGALVPEGSQEGGVRGFTSPSWKGGVRGGLINWPLFSRQSPPDLPLLGGGIKKPQGLFNQSLGSAAFIKASAD